MTDNESVPIVNGGIMEFAQRQDFADDIPLVAAENVGQEGNEPSIQRGPKHGVVIGAENTNVDTGLVTNVATLKPTSLTFNKHLTFEEWQEIGVELRKWESGIQWWIGDWLRYGEHNYGETYSQAMKDTSLSYQTLANTVWVAGKIEPSRRREKLSFKHHSEVAGLEPVEQDALLGEAEARDWTSMELRTAVKTYKREKKIAGHIDQWPSVETRLENIDPLDLEVWPRADLVVVIPPIYHGYRKNVSVAYQWASRAKQCLKRNGSIVFIANSDVALRASAAMRHVGIDDQTAIVWEHIYDVGFEAGFVETHDLVIWGGSFSGANGGLESHIRSVWKHPPVADPIYPTEKPRELVEQIIDFSTQPGDTIVNPYAGVGTVLEAARRLHRNYWGAEPDKEWYALAERRTGGAI